MAALHKYGGPCVIVDLGTAITFDAISAKAEYLGGIIAAGIGISVEALFSRTARLPLVDFRKPASVIGTNTVASMQSGLYYGAIGAIDGMIERLIEELGPETRTIATGGQAVLIAGGSRYIRYVDENLRSTACISSGFSARIGRGRSFQAGYRHAESDPEPFSNYFNYFTEIEEHFQRARGTGLFLLSPLDWALIETWRIPASRLKPSCGASTLPSKNGAPGAPAPNW